MKSNSFIKEKFSENLIFFGLSHTQETNKIFQLIEEIKNFKPDIILLEGGFDKAIFESENEAIKKGGEMAAISFFAKKEGITLIPNDPNQEDEIEFIEKKFGRDFAFLYFFLRNLSFYNKFQIMEDSLQELKDITKWKDFDFSLQNVKRIFFNIMNEPFDESKDYSRYFNPTLSLNKLNSTTRKLNKFRDEFMIDKIKILINENKKICIAKGSYHLYKNKNTIKEIIK